VLLVEDVEEVEDGEELVEKEGEELETAGLREKMETRWKMGKSSGRKKRRSWRLLLGASGDKELRRGALRKKNAAVEISRRHRFLALASYCDLPCILHRTATGQKDDVARSETRF
jgi:hypothetical protein